MAVLRGAALVLGLTGLLLAEPATQLAQADGGSGKALFLLDFADYKGGLSEDWLKRKGFVFERDMGDRRRIDFGVAESGLILEAKRSAHGLMIDQSVNVENHSRIRIEWGVKQFPKGASYENGARSEAIMVMAFFGREKISSGSMLIPDSPYFLGLFLCEGDRVGHPYVGRYFKKGGRYICVDKPAAGKAVVSEFNLVEAFKASFGSDKVPAISALAISVDTSNAKGDGRSSAFVRSIRFLE